MQSNGFELSIEIDGGRKRLPEYGKNGRSFIEGRRGYPYQIRFRNSRAERVLAIPSVDGLGVIDGKPATPEASGYIVQAYSSLTIKGWRTSMSEIHQFEFSEKSCSYAGKTEGQVNCGIIAVQVYGEKRQPVVQDIHIHHIYWPPPPPPIPPFPWPDIQYTSSVGHSTGGLASPGSSEGLTMKSCLSADAPEMTTAYMCRVQAGPEFNLGTGFGAAATDHVTYASFERGLWLATLEIYYSDRDGLLKDGIQVDKSPELATGFPQAFSGFCKPPGY